MPKESSNIKEKSKFGLKEPDKFQVIFHNDDFTPMDFVTYILIRIFFKNEVEAETLMLKVHQEGKAVVGTYTYDIALTKATMATDTARKNGYPLRISLNRV